jgi:uncharacterized protein (DUF305 family)
MNKRALKAECALIPTLAITCLGFVPAMAQSMPDMNSHPMHHANTQPTAPTGTMVMGKGHMSVLQDPNATALPDTRKPVSPSTQAFMEASMNMHAAMEVQYSGKVGLDFATMMIPHHQGAIDMAKIALRYSKDRQTRRLAQKIIKAQEAEVIELKTIAKRLGQ